MVEPEWGTKRLCRNYGARFYDLARSEIACPKCGAPYDPAAPAGARRSMFGETETSSAKKSPDPAVATSSPPIGIEKAKDSDAVDGDDEKSDAEDIIEDASELGEDEDDVAVALEGSRKDDDG